MLVYNPHASTTSTRTRDVIASALGEGLKLDLAETQYRAHAIELGRQARADGVDVVIALGGDGTANEVATGLLHDDINGSDGTPVAGDDVPAFAVVPGGCTNVFARAVGYPTDPVEATGQILEALRLERRRTVSVGLADDRPFLFAAGLGLDAEVVALVEQARDKGATVSRPLYVRCAIRHIMLGGAERRHAPLRLLRAGEEPVETFLAIIANADPWSYLMERPVRATPDASYDSGLDVFALTRLRTIGTLRTLASMLGEDARPKGRQVHLEHDLAELTIETTDGAPRALQVDGDHIGEAASIRFRNMPAALRVVV
jgi:diacylglycerol kinase family enzyme